MTVVAYETGSVTSLANLAASILAKAATYGWTVTGSSAAKNGLSCAINVTGATNAEVLRLVGTAGGVAGFGPACMLAGKFGGNTGGGTRDIVWPATYHMFFYSNPDLIVVALNHDAIYWQYLIFGFGHNLGATGDAGKVPFYWGTFHEPIAVNVANLWNTPFDGSVQSIHNIIPFSFTDPGRAPTGQSGYAYLNEGAGFDKSSTNLAFKWMPRTDDGSGKTPGILTCNQRFPGGTFSIARRQPNLWNGDNVFAEIRVAMERPDGFWSWMFEIPHIRLARNDFYADGDIVARGSDQWMIAPCRKKDLVDRKCLLSTVDNSGTYAFALLKADT